jgi:hypothetical protein
MENTDTGLLLNKKNIELHRQFFSQFVRLLGINVQFRAPREDSKGYNNYGELDTFYYEPITVGCIYDEHPNQKTMRKLGWNTELADTSTVIHVPYDLDKVQAGALFIIPSGLDNAEPRIFKVLRMSNTAIYPCSITCELGPIWNNDMKRNEVELFENSNFNVLATPEEDS